MPTSQADGGLPTAPEKPQGSWSRGFRAKLAASLSAVALIAAGAVLTPFGTKAANLIWPDPPAGAEGTPTPVIPSATAVAANNGCRPGGPALSVALSYKFRGSTWWATADVLPASILEALNAPGEPEPSDVLAKYNPVQSQHAAGTLLELVATGCGAKPVVILGMHAKVTKRAKPLSGSVVWRPPQGNLDVTTIGFNLDAAEPSAQTYESRENKLGRPYFEANAVQVAPGETVPMSVMGLTKRSYLEWSIAFETLVDGHSWNFTVSLPGDQPIQSTAAVAAYGSAYQQDVSIPGFKKVDPAKPWLMTIG
ncbi:hypothetical protein [Micromonospora sp. 4G55]|uniref:hypothetical protein n=1 Tax=Micromonospora sp. 4G55 TaxID=2806102 RepID=UPI001A5E6963|nr:hypothetical protein [Micromonospora sp. 4G55]MBM0259931.1 hypothetical protein [Micromonospora sp. 4G55]